MEGIIHLFCLFLLMGFTESRLPSPDEAALDFIYKNLDDNADPCQNFQKFSSGKFESLNAKAKLKDLGDSIRHTSNGKLQRMLNHLRDRVLIDDSSAEGKALRLYDACLHSSATLQFSSLLELMPPGEDLPWPTSSFHGSRWPEESFQWLEALAQLRRFGIENLIFRMNVIQDWNDPSRFVVYLSQPTRPIILDEDLNRKLLTSIGVPKKSFPAINTLVAGIAALQADLQNLQPEERITYTLSIEEFEDQTGIQLSKYLETSFGRPFDSSFQVKIDGMRYLEGLQAVIEKYSKEVVAIYMIIGTFISLIELGIVMVVKSNPQEECAAAVRRQMEPASELLYKDYYFRQGRKQRYEQEVQQMFEVLRAAFLERIERNHLNLTANEQSYVKQKLLATKVRLGSLPNVPDQRRFVDDFYSDLELEQNTTNLARIQVNILEHHTRRTLKQLDRPTPRDNHFFVVQEFGYMLHNEPHHRTTNLVVLPLEVLQEPYFSPDQHDVFKVSLLGFSMIRAALKNYSPYNMRYDNESNYSEILENFKDNLAYAEAKTCLSQYEESEESELDEYAIDVVALGLIYDVYFGEDSKFSQEQPSNTKVPLKQIFLLNFAQNLMHKYNTVRLNQAVRNLKDFGEVFNCPADTILNPKIKCEIW